MIAVEGLFNELQKRSVTFFTGVPDSLLKSFSGLLADKAESDKHIIAANEGTAVGIAAGHHLATREIPLVYLQNAGLGNIINPVVSLLDKSVYGIPMLFLVGWRGAPGIQDEPQHKKQGEITLELLEVLGIPYAELTDNGQEISGLLDIAIEHIQSTRLPYVLLVRKGVLSAYSPEKNLVDQKYDLTREQALQIVLGSIDPKGVVVSSTGKLSRELFEVREKMGQKHNQDFLVVGSMGHASQIALGIAMARPKQKVYCFDGDGAALMHLGGMATIGALAPNNLTHIIFNNQVHESVGGQPTTNPEIAFGQLAQVSGYQSVIQVSKQQELEKAIKDLAKENKLGLLEIKIACGSRDDLGRPTIIFSEARNSLQNYLNP